MTKKTGGKRGVALLANAKIRRFPYLLSMAALCACASGIRYEGQTCLPSLTNLVIEIRDPRLEQAVSKLVLDTITSMGYRVSARGYETQSQECFIKIDRPDARFIRITQFVNRQDPSLWRSQMREALEGEITRSGLDNDLSVLDEITLKE